MNLQYVQSSSPLTNLVQDEVRGPASQQELSLEFAGQECPGWVEAGSLQRSADSIGVPGRRPEIYLQFGFMIRRISTQAFFYFLGVHGPAPHSSEGGRGLLGSLLVSRNLHVQGQGLCVSAVPGDSGLRKQRSKFESRPQNGLAPPPPTATLPTFLQQTRGAPAPARSYRAPGTKEKGGGGKSGSGARKTKGIADAESSGD